ncbi:MAG: Bax inhibitor-1/YccA family protein [bacterium]|nr:Bax inhibitor-1/YccA family protein [bacterium]
MSNPVLNTEYFKQYTQGTDDSEFADSPDLNNIIDESIPYSAQAMTLAGTINKTITLLAIVVLTSLVTYHLPLPYFFFLGLGLLTVILAYLICRDPQQTPVLAPIYAFLEGLTVGSLSGLIDRAYNANIAIDAVLCTMAVIFAMLTAYRLGIIKVTKTFRTIVCGATMGILIYYILLLVAELCGWYVTTLDFGPWALISNGIICGIAAFNLAVDFDDIKNGIKYHAPKFLEWYCAFGLMVTIIWIYIEILRLLAVRRR